LIEKRNKQGPAALRRWAVFATAALVALALAATAEAAAPTVKGTWATEVTATSFRANATIDTGGLSTSYHFDYLPAANYEANLAAGRPGFEGAARIPIGGDAKVFASTTDQEIFQRIAGLTADTAYRYRLVAKNANGEVVGPERVVRTQENSTDFSLPENRGWELVSPVEKNGGSIPLPGALFGGGDFQAAAEGGSIAYDAAISFGEAAGAPGASEYVATRSASGWSTRNLTLATEAGAFGPEPDGVPFRIFSLDLSRALALARPHRFLLLQAPSFAPITSLTTEDLRFDGATADLSNLVFSTCRALTPDASEVPGGGGGCDPAFPNLYELSFSSGLQLLNLEPGETQGTPGAELAAQSGAISSDGSRVYWVDGSGALLLRDGSRTLEVDSAGSFQIAGADGGVAYYTKAGHLYRYALSTESSTDLTPAGGVLGVLGASADATYLYYLDGGGLELRHGGAVTPVAADADGSSYPPATGTARVSADGTKLAFLSDLPLTGYESLGELELFRYDASTDSLLCASCNPTGARPLGPAAIPGAEPNGEEVRMYKPRVMDDQGSRIFFESEDALSAKDTNGEMDVYEWRLQGVAGCGHAEGCIGLISSGRGADGAVFVDASALGGDVYFLTEESLVADDPGSTDLYDARIGGGFPPPPSPIPCFGDACQPLPPEPEDPTPGTAFVGTERNQKLTVVGTGKKHKRHKHRRHHRKHRKHPAKKRADTR
jgi:hypothetical protein